MRVSEQGVSGQTVRPIQEVREYRVAFNIQGAPPMGMPSREFAPESVSFLVRYDPVDDKYTVRAEVAGPRILKDGTKSTKSSGRERFINMRFQSPPGWLARLSEKVVGKCKDMAFKEADLVDRIIRYEDGEMDGGETIEFFQELIDTGLAWQLQGSYGRTAMRFIESGYCRRKAS